MRGDRRRMHMIVLNRTFPDSFADEVQERLEELVLAYRVVPDEPGGDGEAIDNDASPAPVIIHGQRTYRGADEIRAFLDELAQELAVGRQFQSDACYLDPDDPSRCL